MQDLRFIKVEKVLAVFWLILPLFSTQIGGETLPSDAIAPKGIAPGRPRRSSTWWTGSEVPFPPYNLVVSLIPPAFREGEVLFVGENDHLSGIPMLQSI